DQERDVALALAQRRQAHLDHVEPVVEVLAEATLPDLLQQVAVGRRDQPYVDLDGLDAADPLELLLLDRAEQLHLHVDRDLADLVEEERAVVRELEAARLAGDGAGERALLVAEELALD